MQTTTISLNDLPKKANYKIYNTETKKYLSRNRKSVWATPSGVLDVISRLCTKQFLKLNNIYEIHIFPIESAIKIPYNDLAALYEEQQKEILKQKHIKLQKNKEQIAKSNLIKEIINHKSNDKILKEKAEKFGININSI